jgi:hypothetical protein
MTEKLAPNTRFEIGGTQYRVIEVDKGAGTIRVYNETLNHETTYNGEPMTLATVERALEFGLAYII